MVANFNGPPNVTPIVGQEYATPAWVSWFQQLYDNLSIIVLAGGALFPNVVNAFTAQQYFAEATLTDASPITWDLNTQQTAYVLLTAAVGGTRQLQNPSNIQNGASYTLVVQQSSTGTNALTYGTSYKWPGGTAPTLSTANNAIDILTFIGHNGLLYGVSQLAFA